MGRRPKQPSKEESWTALAARRGGAVVTDRRGKVKQVRFPLDPFEMVLDTYTVSNGQSSQTYTRARLLFPLREEFRFRMHRRSVFSGIGKFFGMQDLEVGQPGLDRDFIIKADSLGKIQALLLRSAVNRALLTLRAGTFETRRFRKRGVDTTAVRELVYSTGGVLRDGAKLDALVDLFADAAPHLVKAGSAWAEPVAIVL
jgi:hypothetical protein